MGEPAPVIIQIRGDTRPLEDDITNAANRAGNQAGKDTGKKIVRNIGIGIGVGGAGLEKFARSAQETTRQLQRVAVATGLPRESLRKLAADTSNAGFATDDVINTFEALSKQGLTSSGDLQRVANVWDMVGDATGADSAALAAAGTSLAAFGITAKNPEKALNALGAVAFHTKDGIEGFTGFLQKQGPSLSKYGLSVDDIAGAMVALNAHGLSGKKAQVAFSTAIKNSNGDIKKALATLGIGSAEYDKFRGSVAKGSDELNRSAAAEDATITPLQKMHAWFQQLILRSGRFGVIAGQLAPIFMGLGAGLAGAAKMAQFFDTTIGKKLVETLKKTAGALRLTNIQATLMAAKAKIIAIATKAWAVAQRILNLVMSANPIVRIVMLLIALGAALVVAYKKSETFRKFVQAAFKIVKAVISAVVDFITVKVPEAFKALINGIVSVWKKVYGFISGLWKAIVNVFASAATWLLNAGKAIIQGLWNGIKLIWKALWFWYVTIPKMIIGFFAAAITWLFNAGKNVIMGLWNGLKAIWNLTWGWFLTLGGKIISVFANAINWLINAGRRILTGLWNGIRAVWTSVWGWFTSLGGKIIGAFGNAINWLFGAGRRILSGLWNGLRSVWNTIWGFLSSIGGKIWGVFKDAGSWLFNAGKNILTGLWNGIKSAASSVGGFLADIGKGIVNFIIDGLNSILHLPWTLHIPMPFGIPDIGPFTIMPHIPNIREGGLIVGEGTGTSDSNLVAVSNREYVVNARATEEWLPLLEAINWGKPLSSVMSATTPAAGSTVTHDAGDRSVVVNQNYFGPTTSAGRRRELDWTLKYGTV